MSAQLFFPTYSFSYIRLQSAFEGTLGGETPTKYSTAAPIYITRKKSPATLHGAPADILFERYYFKIQTSSLVSKCLVSIVIVNTLILRQIQAQSSPAMSFANSRVS